MYKRQTSDKQIDEMYQLLSGAGQAATNNANITISPNADNALKKLINGLFVKAFKISPKEKNALEELYDGYYVPSIPDNMATTDDVDNLSDTINNTITQNNTQIDNRLNIITNKIAAIAANSTKHHEWENQGSREALSLVFNIESLYNNNTIILSSELLIINDSNSEPLEFLIKEQNQDVFTTSLRPEEVQRYVLSLTTKLKLYIKGNYHVYWYINYI